MSPYSFILVSTGLYRTNLETGVVSFLKTGATKWVRIKDVA